MITVDKNLRYKLYWIDYSDSQYLKIDTFIMSEGLKVLDVGYEFASYIKDKNEEEVKIMAQEFLNELMGKFANLDDTSNTIYVVLKNVGILFDSFVSIDPAKYIKDLSRKMGVILLWEGQVGGNNIFFWPNSDDISMNFENINVHKLELEL